MQAKETGDVVGLIHRVRKKYYHYKVHSSTGSRAHLLTLRAKVALAEFEDLQRKEAAEKREDEDPTMDDEMSRKTPSRSAMPAIDKKKGRSPKPPKVAPLTEPQKIRDEIKILCKTLHNIPAVRGMVAFTE